MSTLQHRSKVQGLSIFTWLVILAIGGLLVMATIRLVPVYLEYSSVRTVINNVINDSNTAMLSEHQIRDTIAKRFQVNRVENIAAKDVKIRKDGVRLRIGVDYEVREPLVANVGLVVTFKRDFEKNLRQ